MDTSNLKNIVILKNLPSNLVEEAFVVLKENQKIKKLELIDKDVKGEKTNKNAIQNNKQNSKDYIINEAQNLIAEYILKIENKNKKENKSLQTLKRKYKFLKTINHILLAAFVISLISNFIF